ncbi:Acyl-CoA N-acyltransferase [Artemisia annua]|uniref:histone acetyltransferase n=1 Tax=Artemisia annua TaxID=35608 RepID=A0A2U1MTI4_ARTAN|nr:Acyl-CoA N-acyltransferase [Artemisia annua]
MPYDPMMNLRGHRPSISYRPIQPSDLEVLVKIHGDLFPIRYEIEFFHNVVHGRDIVSWGAVDRNRPNGQSDEIIGFVTARIVMAKESEVGTTTGAGLVRPKRSWFLQGSLSRKVAYCSLPFDRLVRLGPCP